MVALILPSYGELGYARACAESFLRCTPGGKIYWYDDGSEEGKQLLTKSFLTPAEDASTRALCWFPDNKGLTRSWNTGLNDAKRFGEEYVVCGNADLLFTPGWWTPLERVLNQGWQLVGPCTNAPGEKQGKPMLRQAVWEYYPQYTEPSDDPDSMAETAEYLCGSIYNGLVAEGPINGFCMAARTADWFKYGFSETEVFNPSPTYRMVGQEEEYQRRAMRRGMKVAAVPESFVFHYRSVNRPGKEKGMWMRRSV